MTKEEICHVARELFFDFGFRTVTMDDLARKVGISKKTLYTHFRNKTELIDATVTIFLDQLYEMSERILSDKSLNLIECFFRMENEFSAITKPSNPILLNQLQKYYPAIYQKLRNSQLLNACNNLHKHYHEGIAQKLFRADVDVDFVVKLYINIMFEINHNSFFDEKIDLSYLKKQYLEYHIRAIATPKGVELLEKLLNNPKNEIR